MTPKLINEVYVLFDKETDPKFKIEITLTQDGFFFKTNRFMFSRSAKNKQKRV